MPPKKKRFPSSKPVIATQGVGATNSYHARPDAATTGAPTIAALNDLSELNSRTQTSTVQNYFLKGGIKYIY